MRIRAIIASALVMAWLMNPVAATAFRADAEQARGHDASEAQRSRPRRCSGVNDPIMALESRKEQVKKLMNEGKITREKAEAIIKRIDARIAEINEFNKLTLEEKKEKLVNDCKDRLDRMVNEGKMDRKKADEILRNYTERIRQWDGVGYPRLFRKSREKED